MSLWSQEVTYTYKVNDLLNKQDLKIEELLVEEEELINELKLLNPKLLDYFSNNRIVVKKLIEYIIIEPSDINNKERCYQFPYVSCEIFECEPQPIITTLLSQETQVGINTELTKINPMIGDCGSVDDEDNSSQIISHDQNQLQNNNNSLENNSPVAENNDSSENNQQQQIQDEEEDKEDIKKIKKNKDSTNDDQKQARRHPMLDLLFSFLNNNTLNETLAGYFAKVVTIILNNKPKEIMHYLFCNVQIFEKMLHHIYSKSIAELVQNFLTIENMKCEEKNEQFIEMKLQAIERFIEKFQDYNEEEAANYSQIFCQIVTKYYLICDGKELLEKLVSPSCIKNLFNSINLENQFCATKAIELLNCIANYYLYNSNLLSQDYPENSEYYQLMKQKYEEQPFIQELIANIPLIAKTISKNDKKLGIHRLKLIELIEIVCKMHFIIIDEVLIQNNIIQTILNLFFQFQWNNIFHIQVEKIVFHILSDKKCKQLLIYLLDQVKFTQLLIENSKELTYSFNKTDQCQFQKGNIGFIIKFGNKLRMLKVSENYDLYQQYVERDNAEEWNQFCNNFLNKQIEKQNLDLGNFQDYQLNNMNYQDGYQSSSQNDNYSMLKQYQNNPSQTNSNEQKEGERGFSQIQCEVINEDSYNTFNIKQQQQQLSPYKNKNILFETIQPKSLVDDQNVEFKEEDLQQSEQQDNNNSENEELQNEKLQQLNDQILHNQEVINKKKIIQEKVVQQEQQIQIEQLDQNQQSPNQYQSPKKNQNQEDYDNNNIENSNLQNNQDNQQQNELPQKNTEQQIKVVNINLDLYSIQQIELKKIEQKEDEQQQQNIDNDQNNVIKQSQDQIINQPEQVQEILIQQPNIQNIQQIQQQNDNNQKDNVINQEIKNDEINQQNLNIQQVNTIEEDQQKLEQENKLQNLNLNNMEQKNQQNQNSNEIYQYNQNQERFSYPNYLSSNKGQQKDDNNNKIQQNQINNADNKFQLNLNQNSDQNVIKSDAFSKFGQQLQEFEHKIKTISLQKKTTNNEPISQVNQKYNSVNNCQSLTPEQQQIEKFNFQNYSKDDNCLINNQLTQQNDQTSDIKLDNSHKRSLSTFETPISFHLKPNRDLQEISSNNSINIQPIQKEPNIQDRGQLVQSMIDLQINKKQSTNTSFDNLSVSSNSSILSSDFLLKKKFKVIVKNKGNKNQNSMIQSTIQSQILNNDIRVCNSCIIQANEPKEQIVKQNQDDNKSQNKEVTLNEYIFENKERQSQSIIYCSQKQSELNKKYRQIYQQDEAFLQLLKDVTQQSKNQQKENIQSNNQQNEIVEK